MRSTNKILEEHFKSWVSDFESFPGPLGRVEGATTEAVTKHLDTLVDRFSKDDGGKFNLLDSASSFPDSVALCCRCMTCLMEARGDILSVEFWARFSPFMVRRRPPDVDATLLQRFCATIAGGDVRLALVNAIDVNLWTHALVVSRSAAPDMEQEILAGIRSTLLSKEAAPTACSLTETERADPAVQALVMVYDVLSKEKVEKEELDVDLDFWPIYASLFNAVLRPSHASLLNNFFVMLAERLSGRGDVFGAHLCYLLTGERQLDPVDSPTSLIALLGVEHRVPSNFACLLEPVALQLTETYEYALRCGDPHALCPTIQPFKLVYAMLLADAGFLEKSRKYMALLQAFVKAIPQKRLSDAFRMNMRELNEMLSPHTVHGDGPKVPQMVSNIWGSSKGLFRGIAETTGLAVKPTDRKSVV